MNLMGKTAYPSTVRTNRPVTADIISVHNKILRKWYSEKQRNSQYVDVSHGIHVCKLNECNSNSSWWKKCVTCYSWKIGFKLYYYQKNAYQQDHTEHSKWLQRLEEGLMQRKPQIFLKINWFLVRNRVWWWDNLSESLRNKMQTKYGEEEHESCRYLNHSSTTHMS